MKLMAQVIGFDDKSGQQPVLADGSVLPVGVWGDTDAGVGVFGTSGALPEGTSMPIDSSAGVVGHSFAREGVVGQSVNAAGIRGVSHYNAGVFGESDTYAGVQGLTEGSTPMCYGVFGYATAEGHGVYGRSDEGIGIYGVGGTANGFAGYFLGNVQVAGKLSKSGGGFTIDHPKDPEQQYLSHSFVESPDMLNVYSGNVTTNKEGKARVRLPSYFEDLNTDFRYQLTVIGDFAAAVVAKEIKNNSFTIRTDKGRVKVSWQVTGVRNDEWAKANRIKPEHKKRKHERGKYLHPDLFGKTAVGLRSAPEATRPR
jgi:hypothetical protein